MASLLEFTDNISQKSSSMSAYSDVRLASVDVVVFALVGTSSLSMKMGVSFQAPVSLSSTLYRGHPLSLVFWNEQYEDSPSR